MADSIRLFIYTGSQEAGFNSVPVVSVGSAPAGYAPLPPLVVQEDEVWIIKHAADYNLYALFSKKYLAKNGGDGQLLITLILPANQQLAEGKSTLALLNSILDCFLVQEMEGDKLPDHPVSNKSYVRLLGRYPLEERSLMLPVMKGKSHVAFQLKNTAQLDAMMRYSRYSELENVRQLELGFKCTPTITLQGTPQAKENAKTAVHNRQEADEQKDSENVDKGKTMSRNLTQNGKFLKIAVFGIGVLALLAVFLLLVPSHAPSSDTDISSIPVGVKQNPQPILEYVTDSVKQTVAEDTTMLTKEEMMKKAAAEEEAKKREEEKVKKTEEDKKPEEANKEKADAQKMAAEMKQKTHDEILALVNKGDFAGCKNHPGWVHDLNTSERAAVDAVLYQKNNPSLPKIVQKKIKNYLRGKTFKSWGELLSAKTAIDEMIREEY